VLIHLRALRDGEDVTLDTLVLPAITASRTEDGPAGGVVMVVDLTIVVTVQRNSSLGRLLVDVALNALVLPAILATLTELVKVGGVEMVVDTRVEVDVQRDGTLGVGLEAVASKTLVLPALATTVEDFLAGGVEMITGSLVVVAVERHLGRRLLPRKTSSLGRGFEDVARDALELESVLLTTKVVGGEKMVLVASAVVAVERDGARFLLLVDVGLNTFKAPAISTSVASEAQLVV